MSRGRVTTQDAEYVRAAVDVALGLPHLHGERPDGTPVEDTWLQPGPDGELVRAEGGTRTYRDAEPDGTYVLEREHADLLETRGTARARAAARAAIERGPATLPPGAGRPEDPPGNGASNPRGSTPRGR
jgi:hypothetical protein